MLVLVVRLDKGVATGPLEHTTRLLVDDLGLMVKTDALRSVRVLVQGARHLVHEGVTLEIVSFKHPVSDICTLVWELHEWILAARTLVESIVSEASITLANSNITVLVASAVAVAVFLATHLCTERVLFTEAIAVAIVAIFADGAVVANEVGVTLADVEVSVCLQALLGALGVALATRGANFEIERISHLRRDHLRDALVLTIW